MIIKKLSCQYFLNFGSYNEISFEEDQKIISIIGNWYNQSKSSNRSGKSSFLEMIVYALYGKTRAKKEIDLINKNFPDENMFVEIEFDNGIVIKRGRTSSNEMILELTDFEGADKTIVQQEIINLVGMNYEDFITVSFFLQGNIHTFMEAGSTAQKQIISKWLEKDYWKLFEKNAKTKMDEISKQIIRLQYIVDSKPDVNRETEIRDNINSLKQQKTDLENNLNRLQAELDGVTELLKSVIKINDINKQIVNNNKDIINTKNAISNYEDSVLELNKKLIETIKNEIRLKELNGIDDSLLKDKKEILNQLNVKYKEKSLKLSDFKAELKQLKSNFENIDKFDAICPVTKKECQCLDNIETSKLELRKSGIIVANNIKKVEKEINDLEEEIILADQDVEDIKTLINEIKLLKQNSSVTCAKSAISIANIGLENYKIILKEKEDSLIALEKELNKLNKIDFDGLNSKKAEISKNIENIKIELTKLINLDAKLNAELEVIKKQKAESIKAEKEVAECNRQFNIYKYIKFMFGKDGIPFNQIEAAFNEIEEETNIILESMNSDISIEFSPDKETNVWDSECLCCGFSFPKGYRKSECQECSSERTKKRKDELNIIIHTTSGDMDFNQESGGGKVLISLALRLAFVRLLQRKNGVNLQIVCLDEVCSELDEVNRNYVLSMFSNVLIEKFDFKQVFVISHNEDIRDVIPQAIQITRYEDHSTFEWC